MARSNIVVMDIGKTNLNLSVVEATTGEVMASESCESRSLDAAPYLQLDTNHIWSWYLQALKRARQITSIDYICVTAHGATAALVDKETLVLPIMDYESPEPDELADQYDELCDSFDQTYSPKLPHGLNVGRQLFWQRHRFPKEFQRATHLLPYAQYWTWRLTGKPAAEVTTLGSHSDLWNPVARSFSAFARKQGFDRLIPPLMPADALLGHPTDEICQATGIDPDCKVLVGIHDSNASLLPYLKSRQETHNKNFTVMSTGTWVIIFAVGAPLEKMDPLRDCAANVNMYSEPVACGRFMGGREFAAVAGDSATEASVADLVCLMDEDIFALPAFAQEGGPFPGLDGQIRSSRALTTSEHYALGSLYCALVSDVSLSLCGSLGDIIVEGAYAKNTLLLQCLHTLRQAQDVGQTVLGSTDTTGTTMGTAMLATRHISAPTLIATKELSPDVQSKILDYRTRWLDRTASHQRAHTPG